MLALGGPATRAWLAQRRGGIQIDGLAITTHDEGAKAVLATLREVADPSIPLFVAKLRELFIFASRD